MTDTRFFDTQVINLQKVYEQQFSIPTYQRPYVWGEAEIEKLLTDFYKTFESCSKQPYFIGTILTKEEATGADLIDGQQRFTTLWLIAFAFKKKGIQTDLTLFLEDDNSRLRLGFEIRKEVELYLHQLLGHKNEALEITTHEIEKLPYLKNVAKGLATIENIIDQFDKSKLVEFGNYIYRSVFMVKNKTPKNIDMNHLFATINSAGIQLEQTDIVKSNLLKVIGEEKVLYSKIWEVCENMTNFFERNAKDVFVQSDWKSINLAGYIAFDEKVFKYEAAAQPNTEGDEYWIDQILRNNKETYNYNSQKQHKEEGRESEEIYCRSIINFGQLLLHTYRLHLKREELPDFKGTFHVNRLIEIFSTLEKRNDKEEVKRFLLLLWDIRYLFDKYLIKWISDLDQKTEHLELVNINRNSEAQYSRNKYEKSDTLMLQSVLYFTGDYLRQFWLTPYLDYLHKHKDSNLVPNGDELLEVLESIDNQLSICKDLTDKDATYQLLESLLDGTMDIEEYLASSLGTSFKHYWFQKLEYIIWKELNKKEDWRPGEREKFRNFRITSKNSIEHVFPQNHEFGDRISEKTLHSFGNLALLSVSQNSSYSDQDVGKKRIDFFASSKSTFDTLKLYYIYSDDSFKTWKEVDIQEHQSKMIDIVLSHYR